MPCFSVCRWLCSLQWVYMQGSLPLVWPPGLFWTSLPLTIKWWILLEDLRDFLSLLDFRSHESAIWREISLTPPCCTRQGWQMNLRITPICSCLHLLELEIYFKCMRSVQQREMVISLPLENSKWTILEWIKFARTLKNKHLWLQFQNVCSCGEGLFSANEVPRGLSLC